MSAELRLSRQREALEGLFPNFQRDAIPMAALLLGEPVTAASLARFVLDRPIHPDPLPPVGIASVFASFADLEDPEAVLAVLIGLKHVSTLLHEDEAAVKVIPIARQGGTMVEIPIHLGFRGELFHMATLDIVTPSHAAVGGLALVLGNLDLTSLEAAHEC